MTYIVMASGEDGTEFRPSEMNHPTQEYAEWEYERLKTEGNWPCATMWVEELHSREFFFDLHQERYEADECDLY